MRKRMTFLIGAGVSRVPPTSALTWGQMLQAITKRIVEGADRYELPKWAYPDFLAKYLTETAPRPDVLFSLLTRSGAHNAATQIVAECLGSGEANIIHYLLARFCQSLDPPPWLVTTNFDTYLEQALDGLGCKFLLIPRDRNNLRAWEKSPILLKLHGSIETSGALVFLRNLHREIVLSRSSIPLYAAPNDASLVVDSIGTSLPIDLYKAASSAFTDAQIYVLGYSGNDTDVLPLLERALAQTSAQAYWVLRPDSEPSDRVKQLKHKFGERVKYDRMELEPFLRALAREHNVPLQQLPQIDSAPARATAAVTSRESEKRGSMFALDHLVALLVNIALEVKDQVTFAEFVEDICELTDDICELTEARVLPSDVACWPAASAANFLVSLGKLEEANYYLNFAKAYATEPISTSDPFTQSSLMFKLAEIEANIRYSENGPAAAFNVLKQAWEHLLDSTKLVPARLRIDFVGLATYAASASWNLEECRRFGSILYDIVKHEQITAKSVNSLLFFAMALVRSARINEACVVLDWVKLYAEDTCNDVVMHTANTLLGWIRG